VIRVLVVDDSPVVRRVLTDALHRHRDFEVVGGAEDPYAAREAVLRLRPDVLTLDLELPRMDGLRFLEKLMRHFPIPTVVVSSRVATHPETAARALALGAAGVVAKPAPNVAPGAPEFGEALAAAVRAAAARARRVLAIGASTGGPVALERVLSALPAHAPGTVVVQHMPGAFTASFAERLNAACTIEVREARDGDAVVPGLALIAPGGRHLVLQRAAADDAARGAHYTVRVKDGPPVHHQRPAVDVLFESVARHVGADAVGVLLTGMGADGAKGLLAMRAAGAHTVAQDEATSVVFGMPREAIRLGAACEVSALSDVPTAVLRALTRLPRAA